MKDPSTFVEEFNSAHENPPNSAKIILQGGGREIYGVKIRFLELHHRFETSQFEDMQIVVQNFSRGGIILDSSYEAANRGIINLSVNFCNHRYNPGLITKVLEYIVNIALPRSMKGEKDNEIQTV